LFAPTGDLKTSDRMNTAGGIVRDTKT